MLFCFGSDLWLYKRNVQEHTCIFFRGSLAKRFCLLVQKKNTHFVTKWLDSVCANILFSCTFSYLMLYLPCKIKFCKIFSLHGALIASIIAVDTIINHRRHQALTSKKGSGEGLFIFLCAFFYCKHYIFFSPKYIFRWNHCRLITQSFTHSHSHSLTHTQPHLVMGATVFFFFKLYKINCHRKYLKVCNLIFVTSLIL